VPERHIAFDFPDKKAGKSAKIKHVFILLRVLPSLTLIKALVAGCRHL
jgi:hypothetical protein